MVNSWSEIGLMKAYKLRNLFKLPVAVDASPIVPLSSLDGRCKMRLDFAICCSISVRKKFNVSIGGLTNLRYSPLNPVSPSLIDVFGFIKSIPVGENLLLTPLPEQLPQVRYPPLIGSNICPSLQRLPSLSVNSQISPSATIKGNALVALLICK